MTELRFAGIIRQFGAASFPQPLPQITRENIYQMLAISVLAEENGREQQQLALIGDNPAHRRAFSNIPKSVRYRHLSPFGRAAARLKLISPLMTEQTPEKLLNHPDVIEAAQQIKNKQQQPQFAEILDNMMAVPLAETLAHQEFPDLDLTLPIEHHPLMTIAVCSNRQKIYQLTGEKDFTVLLHFGQNLTSNLEKICNTPCINQYISLINTQEPIHNEFHQGGICRLLEFTAVNMGYDLPLQQESYAFRPANSNFIDDFYPDGEKNRIPCLNQNDPAVEVALNAVTENYPQIITEDGAVRFICEHARPVIRGLGYCYCPQDRCLKTPQQFPPLTSLNDLIRRSYPERYPQPRPKPFASATRKRYGRA